MTRTDATNLSEREHAHMSSTNARIGIMIALTNEAIGKLDVLRLNLESGSVTLNEREIVNEARSLTYEIASSMNKLGVPKPVK